MDFVAIDVETANPNMASICQIGIAGFRDGRIVSELEVLVNPEDWFSPFNVRVHGITEDAVVGAPTLAAIEAVVREHLDDHVVVSHTPFDRLAIHQAFGAYDLEPPSSVWLDSARVARRTWSEVSQRGYGLANVCNLIGYEFAHHNALEDAKAAGHVVLAAMALTGTTLEDWLVRAEHLAPVNREGNPEGPLSGEIIVFTGSLQVPRREAAGLAAGVGCEVGANVTKHTTMLVVGDQDATKLAGHAKSSKHRKAEELISCGQPIRILRESDFMRLVALEDLPAGS